MLFFLGSQRELRKLQSAQNFKLFVKTHKRQYADDEVKI